jgi:hypothetical protein
MGAKQTRLKQLKAGKHDKYNKLQLFVSDVRSGLLETGQDLFDVAFNVVLVALGVRSATLIERADYYPDNRAFDVVVNTLQRVVPRYTSAIQMTMRDATNTQFLVYNRALSRALVSAALGDDTAMGQVLGFQCAGELASPFSVKFYVVPSPNLKKEFYVEMCSERPDMDTVERQLAAFRDVARKLHWGVTVSVKQSMRPHEVAALLRTGDERAIAKHRTNVREQLNKSMLYTLEAAPVWNNDMTAAAVLNAVDDFSPFFDMDVLNAEQDSAVSAASAQGEALLLPSRVGAWTPVDSIRALDDVLAAIANEQYELLNSTQGRADIESLLNPTCAPRALSLLSKTPSGAEWTVFYVFLAMRIMHNPASALHIEDPYCMEALDYMLSDVQRPRLNFL